MSPVIFRRLLLAALLLQAFAGCSEDSAPPTPAVPGAQSVATTGLRLNEIGFRPADGAPTFVEIGNSGSVAISLDGAMLRSESGASFELPPGVTIEPGALLVVSFDNRNGFTDGAMHAPAADFPAREAGSVRLEISQGPADAVIWGMPDLASVDLCRGGRCASPAVGSVLARLPNTKEPFTPAVWTLLDPELATPGEPNPRPPVSAFAAMPGMIFTGMPRFSWYGVPGAVSYRLQVARDDAFKSLMHETDVAATAGVRLEQLTAHGPELPPGHYFWRVQALGAAGEPAPFSRPMPFSVDPSRRLPSGSRAPRQAPAGDRPPAGTPGDGTARSAAEPPRIPEGLLEVLEVPVLDHAKDTRMLALEAPSEEPLWSWDTPDFAGYPYCARAGVAMVNAFYRGRLSQDRIGYEVYKNLREGPEYDLPVVGIMDRHTSEYALPLAIGTSGQYERNPYIALGEDRNACMDYIREQALEFCASQCVTKESEECAQCRIARTNEISCPAEIAYRWGQRAIKDIQREINAGRPIIATSPTHLFLIVGYRLQDGRFSFFYQDAGGREEVPANASGFTQNLDSYWTGLAPTRVGSDEPEVRRDSDGDGVVDFDEIERFGTDPSNDDSDADGVKDKQEIRASVWDPEHGYHGTAATLASTAPYSEVEEKAANADMSGRDFDQDSLAMERDPDSDNGGCLDGMEDADKDGHREESAGETSVFSDQDDGCVSGTFVAKSDITHSEDGVVDWMWGETHATLALTEATGGLVTGVASVTASFELRTTGQDPCALYETGRHTVRWQANIIGSVAEGALYLTVDTPEPDYTVDVAGCGSSSLIAGQWPGFDLSWGPIAFTDGRYDFRHDYPLRAGETGHLYVELHLVQPGR
jgi:hypothetical protein